MHGLIGMILKSASFRFAFLIGIACMLSGRCFAHIVSTDTLLQLIAEPDKARGELWIPISGILTYQAEHSDNKLTPTTSTSDPEGLARSEAELILDGLKVSYDQTAMTIKLIGTTVRNLNTGLSMEETDPVPMAVYTLEFTSDQPIPKPNAVMVEHNMLPIPEEYSVDRTVVCLVKFRQSDQSKFKSEVITSEQPVDFKCDWPKVSATPAPSTLLEAEAPAAGSTRVSSRGRAYLAAGLIAVVAGGVLWAVLRSRRSE